jgi:osmoprotectant transport system substrate-binding protein
LHARRNAVAALLVLAALVVAGCGGEDGTGGGGGASSPRANDQPGRGKPPLTIGTKDFPEEFVLGDLYAQALRAKGYTVSLKSNIGPTETTDEALTSRRIDAYPEYTGITLSVLAHEDLPKTPEATATRAETFYARRGQTVIGPTPFENVDVVATRKGFATKHHLKSLADLEKLPSFTLGARPEFKSRFTGLREMRRVYGITDARFEQIALGRQYEALDSGEIDAVNGFSTDPQLASGRYAVLEDPKGIFGFQNVDFVINTDTYDALGGRGFGDVVAAVNTLLTNDAMQKMTAAVALDRKPAKDVAARFLRANGLAGANAG